MNYWLVVSQLALTERVKDIEAANYQRYPDIIANGEFIMAYMSRKVLAPILPSSLVLFGQPAEDTHESAYLIAPTLIPPSVALRQITTFAESLALKTN